MACREDCKHSLYVNPPGKMSQTASLSSLVHAILQRLPQLLSLASLLQLLIASVPHTYASTRLLQVLIVSYETFRLHTDRFKSDTACDLLICDEAHRLKNDQLSCLPLALPNNHKQLVLTPALHCLQDFDQQGINLEQNQLLVKLSMCVKCRSQQVWYSVIFAVSNLSTFAAGSRQPQVPQACLAVWNTCTEQPG